MHKKRFFKGKKGFGVFLPCTLAAIALILLFSFIGAIAASSSGDTSATIPIYSLLALVLAAAISGFITSRIKGEGGIKTAALSALTIVLLMMLIAIIVSGTVPTLSALMNYCCYMAVAVFSAFLGRKRGRHGRR